nr:translation initiation factor IF-2-like [Drosophila suzukii]
MRPQGRKLALILEWQPRRSDLGADFNPEWYSGTSVGTPDPRTPHSHVVSHKAVKRIPRPEQRPQSGPAAPNKRPVIGVSAPPAAPTHVPTRSTHSAGTAPSAASPAPPAAPSAAQTQQRPAPCSATHVAIRYPQSATSSANSSANRAGHVVTSHTTSVTRSAQRAAPRPQQRSASIGRRHLHHRAPPAAPTAASSAASAPNAQPHERLPPSAIKQGNSRAHRALTTPISAAAHQPRHGKRPPRAHQECPTGGISSANRAPITAPTAAPISSAQPRPQQRQPRRIRGH